VNASDQDQPERMTASANYPTWSILDPVHGLIRLTPEEIRIIDHPLFQRLRGIKQNGLLHLVFPAATHTRFEHSIGTVFVVNSMLDALFHNSKVAASKKPAGVVPLETAKEREAIDFSRIDQSDREMIYRITRLAALVHDLGHGPLSHTFDAFAPPVEVVRGLLQDPQLMSIRTFDSAFDALRNDHAKIEHEAMSCLFFALIWGDGDPDIAVAVCGAILGNRVSSLVNPQLRPWVALAHDLIASAPADADRMDYLERDSRSIGVNYGLFDRNRVLKTFLCYQEKEYGETRYRLGLKKSGMRAIENLLQARFELFAQVYHHKTNRAASLMLDAIAEDGLKQGVDLWPDKSLSGIVKRYLQLTDEEFLRVLCGDTDQVVPPSIQALAQQVVTRQLWKRVSDCEYKETPKKTVAEAENEMAKRQKDFPDVPLRVDAPSSDATKDLDEGAGLLTRQRPSAVYTLSEQSWEEASPIFDALAKRDRSIARIFLCKSDKALASKIRFKYPD
jgi:uncharacterized protein